MAENEASSRANAQGLCHPEFPERRRIRRMDSSSGDFWYVKLTDGDVHRVTLDQLDEAFQAGHIDGETMVLASGASQWERLASVAGMDESEEEQEEVAAPEPEREAAYIPQRPIPSFAQRPAQAAYVQQAQFAPSAPLAYIPQQTHAIPQPAPYGARPAPQPVVPPVIRPSFSPMPNTLRPMSVDFSDSDLDMMPRRRGGVMRWMVPVLALACIGGVGTYAVKTRPSWAQPILNRAGFHSVSTEVAAATMPTPAPAPPPPPAADPTPPPAPPPPPVAAAAPPGADSPLNPRFSDQSTRLTEDQKARLAEADKPKAKGHKSHGGGGGGGPVTHSSSGKGKSTTFTTSGSKYDPLNSSI
jgi:hypothetical protein